MKKTLLILSIIIIISVIYKNNQKDDVIIPSSSIRIRIISNSNSKEDIKTKLALKSAIENYLFPLVSNATNEESADKIISNSLPQINNQVKAFLKSSDFTVNYGTNYFPSKTYKGVIYNGGYYKSLVITIGKGEGENWWCVLFPPLCLLEDNNTTDDVQYKLYISSIIDKFN
jgi:stage II sporulation protein R